VGREIPSATVLSKRKVMVGSGVATAVVLASITALATASRGVPPASAGPGTGPVPAAVEQVALSAMPGVPRAELPQRGTSPFSLLGVTWEHAGERLDGAVQVRVRSAATRRWSGWRALNPQGDDAPDPREAAGARGGTSPLWVGPSDGVQVRVAGSHPRTHLPAGMRLTLVDPGRAGSTVSPRVANMAYVQDVTPTDTATATSPAPSDTSATSTTTGAAPASATTDPAASTTTPSSTTPPATSATSTAASATPTTATSTTTTPPTSRAPMPPISTRADWGADESKRRGSPAYGQQVKVLFVHHTDTANDYTCGDGPTGSKAVIRSLYAYHLSLGWDDIGYNFLVDKCGTLFEGRFGGMDRPVVGAQTYGFNTNSAGVAILGTYISAGATNAALASIARLAAWKLGFAGISADAAQEPLVEGVSDSSGYTKGQTYTFHAVSGHRDGYATQCPGDGLYAQLATIRTWAAGPPTGLAVKAVSGATSVSGTRYTRGAVTVSAGLTSPAGLVTRTELLVDGAVAATGNGWAPSLATTLAPGRHSMAVRAVHVSGRSATSTAVTVVADTTAPTFTTKPYAGLRGGTVSTSSAPVTLAWKAADNTVLKQVQATAPSAATFAATTTSWATAARPGYSTTFAFKAGDVVGNATTASTVVAPGIAQETAAARSGSWASKASSSYLGGYALSTSVAKASLTWTFTGRSVAWVVSRASGSGQAAVYLDGVKVATLDLRSSTTLYRQAIWTHTWSSSARHTVKVVNLATTGRPTITTDAIVYLK
jgi:hypothetical protein